MRAARRRPARGKGREAQQARREVGRRRERCAPDPARPAAARHEHRHGEALLQEHAIAGAEALEEAAVGAAAAQEDVLAVVDAETVALRRPGRAPETRARLEERHAGAGVLAGDRGGEPRQPAADDCDVGCAHPRPRALRTRRPASRRTRSRRRTRARAPRTSKATRSMPSRAACPPAAKPATARRAAPCSSASSGSPSRSSWRARCVWRRTTSRSAGLAEARAELRLRAAPRGEVLGRQVDPPAAEVLGHVLAVLGDLERGADPRPRARSAAGSPRRTPRARCVPRDWPSRRSSRAARPSSRSAAPAGRAGSPR